MLKTYSSKGGTIMATDQYSIDKRAFPFKDETSIDATVKHARYEQINNRRALPAMNTAGILEFLIDPTTDGTMWDLHNSYIVLDVLSSDSANNYGLSQFGANQVITDCDIILGSEYVNEKHVNLYPYSAFVKDILIRPRPAVPSRPLNTYNINPADGTSGTVKFSNGIANTGGAYISEDTLTEANYLSHALFTMATANDIPYNGVGPVNFVDNKQSSLEFTRMYMNNGNFQLKLVLKDSIFMTGKYWPSDNSLRLLINTNISKLLQVPAAGAANLTITNANFYLKRIFLTDEASSAFNIAIRSSDLCYNLPYSRIATYDIPANATAYNVPNVFSDNFRPDLICVFTCLSANTNALPLTACAPPGYNGVPATGLTIRDAYVQMDGQYFPERTCGDNYLGYQEITAYKEYVKNCLQDEDNVYLDWLHWINHYGIVCINTRLDKAKWYGCPPTESNNGFNLYLNLRGGEGAAKLYIVAFNNVKVTINSSGKVHTHGF